MSLSMTDSADHPLTRALTLTPEGEALPVPTDAAEAPAAVETQDP